MGFSRTLVMAEFFMDVELADQFLRRRRFRALSIAGYLLLLFGVWLVGLLGG